MPSMSMRRVYPAVLGGTVLYMAASAILLVWLRDIPDPKAIFDDAYHLIATLFGAICCLGVAWKGGFASRRQRNGWFLMGLGAASWCCGQLLWTYTSLILRERVPYPHVSDIAYLSSYPLLAVGVIFMFPKMTWGAWARLLLDGAIAASSIAIFLWYFLVTRFWDMDVPLPFRLVGAAYPMSDTILVFGAIMLLASYGIRYPLAHAWTLLIFAFAMLAFADTLFAFYTLGFGLHTQDWFDWAWSYAWLPLGHAALLTQMPLPRRARAPQSLAPRRVSVAWISASAALPYVGAVLAVAVAAIHDLQDDGRPSATLFGLGVSLALLTSLRQVFSVVENKLMATRLKTLNAQLSQFRQAILDNVNVWVSSSDPHFNFLVWNRAAERITGYSAKEVVGNANAWQRLFPGENERERVFDGLKTVLAGVPSEDVQLTIEHRNGTRRTLSFFAKALTDEDGAPNSVVHLGIDVTSRKQAEAELIRSSKLAALGAMAAGFAHEVGNPLTSLSTRLRLIEDDPNPDFVRESIGVLQTQITRIAQIVRGVSQLARTPRAGMAPCHVQALIGETISVLRFHDTARRCYISTEFTAPIPAVFGAADQLIQVFLNLGLNALEAMPEGGTLLVRIARQDGMIAVSFSDTGPGLSDETRDKMFDTFYTSKPEGLGLGLSIARSIVNAHGGNIAAVNNPGGGACFSVFLPIHIPAPQATPHD